MSTAPDKPAKSDDKSLASDRRGGNIRSYGVIKMIMGTRVVDSLPLRVRCECSLPACEEIIEISLNERRELRRSFPSGFIVAPSHKGAKDATAYEAPRLNVVTKPNCLDEVVDL